jgi:uncharacterized protein YgbK (DUF1537 family)
MATNPLRQHQLGSFSAQQRTLLIASTDHDQQAFLAAQLDADGHTVYEADSPAAALAKLSVTRSTSCSSHASSDRQTPRAPANRP